MFVWTFLKLCGFSVTSRLRGAESEVGSFGDWTLWLSPCRGGLLNTPNLSAGLLGPAPGSSVQAGGSLSSWGQSPLRKHASHLLSFTFYGRTKWLQRKFSFSFTKEEGDGKFSPVRANCSPLRLEAFPLPAASLHVHRLANS